MSKKKNTLKDLDEFLRQQAAVIVPPAALNEKISVPDEPPVRTTSDTPTTPPPAQEASMESVLDQLKALSKKEEGQFRNKLYDILIRTLEAVPNSTAEDKMLINTALYLKSGDNWKEVIREYWRGKGR